VYRIPSSYHDYWLRVSQGLFLEPCHERTLDEIVLQAALPLMLLDRASAHCQRFPIAATVGVQDLPLFSPTPTPKLHKCRSSDPPNFSTAECRAPTAPYELPPSA
jgi:hypothetical protein